MTLNVRVSQTFFFLLFSLNTWPHFLAAIWFIDFVAFINVTKKCTTSESQQYAYWSMNPIECIISFHYYESNKKVNWLSISFNQCWFGFDYAHSLANQSIDECALSLKCIQKTRHCHTTHLCSIWMGAGWGSTVDRVKC